MSIFTAGANPQLYLMRLIALVIAFTVHEFFHGYAAYRLGDHTAKFDGRLSLNPARHLDPIGTLLIILFGFGWAKPVMFNPYNLRNIRRDTAILAAAGPLSNFVMAFIGTFIYVGLVLFGHGSIMFALTTFMAVFVSLNIMLGVFNLIPIPPLDGSKILAVFLPKHLYFRYVNFRYGFMLLMVLVIVGAFSIIVGPITGGIMDLYLSIVLRVFSLFVPIAF